MVLKFVKALLALPRAMYSSMVSQMPGPVGNTLRRRLYRTTCHLDTAVVVTAPKHFTAGEGSALYHGTYILNTHGAVSIGNSSHLGAFCYVNACYGRVLLGDDVAIGPGSKLIAYSNHYAPHRKVTDERICSDILIGNNVFVGANVTILPGTIIEDHVIVAAGAVVKGRLATDSIYGGIPARLLRSNWYAPRNGEGRPP